VDRAFAGRLQASVDQAIKNAHRVRAKIPGAVNWADLSATIEFAERADGDCFWRVIIEEAGPENPPFQEFISSYLERRGFRGIEVITEW
jgi:hypothetical protein